MTEDSAVEHRARRVAQVEISLKPLYRLLRFPKVSSYQLAFPSSGGASPETKSTLLPLTAPLSSSPSLQRAPPSPPGNAGDNCEEPVSLVLIELWWTKHWWCLSLCSGKENLEEKPFFKLICHSSHLLHHEHGLLQSNEAVSVSSEADWKPSWL